MLIGHWFTWQKLLGRKLTRLEAYSYGVAWIILIPSAFAGFLFGAWEIVGYYMLAMFGAGTATFIAHAIDAWIENKHRRMDVEHELQLNKFYAEIERPE